ncbi:MAG TPA: alpha-amylase family glycosyl hydrolase [Candidatus Rifleibacterium sp.]|nr:alpha-amylase family glycosyl hydrolase [Candidatus Rifleibacterium sp.]HPT46214.1 alpha-amylase family glycosyl hydrolase [Candidatus Rifleibacterium sp.]
MYGTALKRSLGLALAMFVALSAHAADFDKDFAEGLNRVARDMHIAVQAAHAAGSAQDQAKAALARESAGLDSFKRLVATIETVDQIDEATEQLRVYGARVGSTAEKRAFDQGMQILEGRVKFLAQTENPKLNGKLSLMADIRKDVADSYASTSDKNFVDSQTLQARRTSRVAAAPARRTASGLLGANVVNGNTNFAVYAPEATDVKLHLFKAAADKKGTPFQMTKGNDGVWRHSIKGEIYGTYYGFTTDGPKGPGYLFDPERLLSDPYAFANVDHDGKSIVVDRNFTWTVKDFKRPASKDAVIYEMHVKDFTAHKSSGVVGQQKGKYLGLLQGKGTGKVLGHLKELGVNVIELMPIHEFDNNFAGTVNHWGYMTSHFFAPECSYATGKGGDAVKEFKGLIDGLHREGFAVILDVVFNHTAEGDHQGLPLNFKGFDNGGYYRLMDDNRKFYWNGTGCGNEMRTENPMTGKMIVDSLKYWVDEYKVDGFRFDLGTIIDKKTMQRIIDELPKDIILTSEPWAADWKRNQWGKSDFRNTRLSKWNDDFREKVRAMLNGQTERNDVMTVLAGSCFWWAAKPDESLNYLEAHDGYTLNDLYKGDKKKTRLAAIALLTAQGIPMIHFGQEFNRTKGGNHNSYDQDNNTNYIDWETKEKNRDIFDLYKGLIAMRKKYPNFRQPVALNNQHLEWVQPANNNGLGMFLKGDTNFLVLLNGDQNNWVNFKLPLGGTWKVICDGEKFNDAGLYTAEGDYNVPSTTGVILKK